MPKRFDIIGGNYFAERTDRQIRKVKVCWITQPKFKIQVSYMHKRTKGIPQHQAKVKDEGILDRLREYVARRRGKQHKHLRDEIVHIGR
jgi:hypothetical protein